MLTQQYLIKIISHRKLDTKIIYYLLVHKKFHSKYSKECTKYANTFFTCLALIGGQIQLNGSRMSNRNSYLLDNHSLSTGHLRRDLAKELVVGH